METVTTQEWVASATLPLSAGTPYRFGVTCGTTGVSRPGVPNNLLESQAEARAGGACETAKQRYTWQRPLAIALAIIGVGAGLAVAVSGRRQTS